MNKLFLVVASLVGTAALADDYGPRLRVFNEGTRLLDAKDAAISDGLLYTFEGRSSKPLFTSRDSSGERSNPWPVSLTAAGELPADMWIPARAYTVLVLDRDGTVVMRLSAAGAK